MFLKSRSLLQAAFPCCRRLAAAIWPLVIVFGLSQTSLPTAFAQPTSEGVECRFIEVVQPLLKAYCVACHGDDRCPVKRLFNGRERSQGPSGLGPVLERLEAEEMPPEKATRQPDAARPPGRHRLDRRRSPSARPSGTRAIPGPVLARRLSNAEYRLHDPRPDGRRHPADARVPRRSGQRGRVRQLGRIADDVAGPGEEVPGGGAAGRRPPRPEAGRLRLRAAPGGRRHRPRQVLRPTGSSTSTSGSGPTTPTTSWPPGGSSTARPWASPRRRWPTSPPRPGSAPSTWRRSGRCWPEPGRRSGPIAASPGARGGSLPADARSTQDEARRAAASGCAISSSGSATGARRREVENLPVQGISAGSQPFVLWKNRQTSRTAIRAPRHADDRRHLATGRARRPTRPTGTATFERFCRGLPRRVLRLRAGARTSTEGEAGAGRLLSAGFHSMKATSATTGRSTS